MMEHKGSLQFDDLTLHIRGAIIPLMQCHEEPQQMPVQIIQKQTINEKGNVPCTVDLQKKIFPGTFWYVPNEEIWGEHQPLLVNIKENNFDIPCSIEAGVGLQLAKGETIGYLKTVQQEEVLKEEDIPTWKWDVDKRMDQIVKDVNLEENVMLN